LHKNLHNSGKSCTFALQTQKDTTMAQETLNGLLQYVLLTLPLEDKVWFSQQMEQDIRRLQAEQDEIDRLDRAIDMSLEDVTAGRVYTQDQAKQMRAQLADSMFLSTAV